MESRTENVKNKAVDFIKTNYMSFIVVIISLIYVFYNLVKFEKTELKPIELLIKGAIAIITGMLIKNGLGENGFSKGYASGIWKEEKQKYLDECNVGVEYIEQVDNYYSCDIINKTKKYRKSILQGNALKYANWFDDNGNYIDNIIISKKEYAHRKLNKEDLTNVYGLDRKQRKCLKRAIKIKIYTLDLFTEYGNYIDGDNKKEKGDNEQRAKMYSKNGIMGVIVGIMGVYFIPLWDGWNWASLLVATLQVCLWVGSGIMQLYKNYNYITVEKVEKLRKKKFGIETFVSGCKRGLYKTDPFTDMEKSEVINNERVDEKEQVCSIG